MRKLGNKTPCSKGQLQAVLPTGTSFVPKVIAIAVALTCAQAGAASGTWVGGSGNGSNQNKWSTAANWNGGSSPGTGDTATITGTYSFAPNVDRATTLGILNYSKNATSPKLSLSNTLTIEKDYNNNFFSAGNSFDRYANVTVNTGGAINASTTSGTNTNASTFQQLSVNGGAKTAETTSTTLSLGNIHVGQVVSKDYTIYNMAGTGGVTLRGAIQGTGIDSRLSGTGVDVVNSSWTALAGGAGVSKTVTFNGTTAGSLSNQKVTVVNNFGNTNQQTLNITGAAYNLANGIATPSQVTIAAQRVGGSNSQALTVLNNAPTGNYTEHLDASFGTNVDGARNNGGSISLLKAGSTSTAMAVGVDTSSAGAKSGSVVLNYTSNGTGTSELGNTNVGSQTIKVSGNVYQSAAASNNAVNFGIVHVGDSVSTGVATNSAAIVGDGAFNDTLKGNVSVSGTGFSGGGNFSGVVAQTTDSSAKITLNTANAGAYSGTANLTNLASQNSEMANLALENQSVALTAQVNNYANASFADYSGKGSLTGSGATYVLDFGQIKQGTGSVIGNFSVMNSGGSASYTDLMNGTFVTTGNSAFLLSGFNSIEDLAGGSKSALSVTLKDNALGEFKQTVTLNYGGSNSSGYAASLGSINLELRGVVAVAAVPEPETWAMLIAGLGIISLRVRGMKDRGSKLHS